MAGALNIRVSLSHLSEFECRPWLTDQIIAAISFAFH